MRILKIAPTPFFADRGCHVRILEETKVLMNLGNNVTICTYHNGRDIEGLNIKRILKIPWYKKLEAGPSYHMLYLDALLLLRSIQCIIKEKPDIIHAHLHEGVFIGKFLSKFSKTPLVFDAQGSLVGEMIAHEFVNKDTLLYRLFHKIERVLSDAPGAIITSNKQMADILENEFNINGEKIFVIQDGVNVDFFRPGLDTGEIRKQLSIHTNKKIIVYLGLLNKYQGVDLLIESIPYVVNEISDVHFLIMGFPNEEYYIKKAKKLNIAEYVTFTGRINYFEAHLYLNLGDIAVSPKITLSGEGNGKIYNYIACGLPTVVFDFPINREILGNIGVYAKKVSSESLAEEMIKLLLNDKKRKELSNKVREKAVNEYSWKAIGRKIMEVYEWVT